MKKATIDFFNYTYNTLKNKILNFKPKHAVNVERSQKSVCNHLSKKSLLNIL